MFKQLFRLTFITLIWSRYKSVIVSTILLFIFFWLINKVHADFLTYSELQNSSEHLGLSFVVKWVVMLAGILLYFLYNHLARKSRRKKPAIKKDYNPSDDNDPFAEIRKKDKLKSKSDFILEKKSKK